VEQFEGANIQIDFGPGVPAQVRQGVAPLPGGAQLPSNTHYRLYGIRETRDSSGAVTSSSYVELQRFEIHRIVEKFNPCYIDPEEAVYPGLQASKFEARIKEDTGITNIESPPVGATEEQLIDVATAMQRTINIDNLAKDPNPAAPGLLATGGLKAVTSASVARYPAVGTACALGNPSIDRTLIPPDTCTDNESNQLRLDVCNKVWVDNPGLYEGSDRVLTEPLAGEYFGVVTGLNPINDAVLGGTQFFVEDPAIDYDAFAITFQFDDTDGDGEPNYPTGATPSDTGTMLLMGRPNSVTRGVTRAPLAGSSPFLASAIAVFSDLGGDDVHF
jgi:hypothetical protein